jgi:hypothetical protein
MMTFQQHHTTAMQPTKDTPAAVHRVIGIEYNIDTDEKKKKSRADCPGRKPPFLVFKRPPRPYKNTMQKGFS